MTDETAKELAAAMLKLAEAINALNGKSGGLGGFTVYHQHSVPQNQWGSPYPYPPGNWGSGVWT
jgi:hypothetical protein